MESLALVLAVIVLARRHRQDDAPLRPGLRGERSPRSTGRKGTAVYAGGCNRACDGDHATEPWVASWSLRPAWGERQAPSSPDAPEMRFGRSSATRTHTPQVTANTAGTAGSA